jgi:hypothetical protein
VINISWKIKWTSKKETQKTGAVLEKYLVDIALERQRQAGDNGTMDLTKCVLEIMI